MLNLGEKSESMYFFVRHYFLQIIFLLILNTQQNDPITYRWDCTSIFSNCLVLWYHPNYHHHFYFSSVYWEFFWQVSEVSCSYDKLCTSFETWSHNTIQHDFLLLLRPVATQYMVHYYHRPRNGIYLTLWCSWSHDRSGIQIHDFAY